MDSFALRQEQAELQKSVIELKHLLTAGELRIKELHEEEMRYLTEIPNYKQQAKDAQVQVDLNKAKLISVNKELELANKNLISIQGLVTQQNQALIELRDTQAKIIEETKAINAQITQRHEDLKQREEAGARVMKDIEADSNKIKYANTELDKRESEISNKEKSLQDQNSVLEQKMETHKNNVELHNKKVDALLEAKELHASDEQVLKDKLARADKLFKENADTKASLVLQAENLSKQLQACAIKNKSLDNNLADLKNQENTLKIKELRVNKLIRDHGLEKELKELEDSLK